MHLEPSAGRPRPVGEAIIDMLFPGGQDGRIPIVGVTAPLGRGSDTTRLIAHMLRRAGWRVGFASSDGIYFDGRRLIAGDGRNPAGARAVLLNPAVQVAVLEATIGGVLEAGLGFDRCDVAVLAGLHDPTPYSRDTPGTPQGLVGVAGVLASILTPGGTVVLSADDPQTHTIAARYPGSALYIARDERHPFLDSHRDSGGRAAFLRDGGAVLAMGPEELSVGQVREVLSPDHATTRRAEDYLAAAGAAWVLGVSAKRIRETLQSFTLAGTP
jgi:cyanophycin synthetase